MAFGHSDSNRVITKCLPHIVWGRHSIYHIYAVGHKKVCNSKHRLSLIKQTKEPKRNFLTVPDIDTITDHIAVFYPLNLLESFALTAYFK